VNSAADFPDVCLVSNGFPVSNGLAEIDRPDLVNALVHEI